jgi:hypothetical protein
MSGRVANSGNDATDTEIASANCAYCAVGGLIGKSANTVMRDVYARTGALPPSGMGNDGSLGFAIFYAMRSRKEMTDTNRLEFQVEGVAAYLEFMRCTVKRIGGLSSTRLLNRAQLLKTTNKLRDGTVFLALTGDEDVPGWGITSLGHWTVGQKQNGRAMFYDHQMKISDDWVRGSVARRSGKEMGETGATDYPVTAWGNKLDKEDGRGLLLVVSK